MSFSVTDPKHCLFEMFQGMRLSSQSVAPGVSHNTGIGWLDWSGSPLVSRGCRAGVGLFSLILCEKMSENRGQFCQVPQLLVRQKFKGDMITFIQQNRILCLQAPLFTIAQQIKKYKYPSTREQINRLCQSYNEILLCCFFFFKATDTWQACR